jgi:predicted PurR-regulated permease PerM
MSTVSNSESLRSMALAIIALGVAVAGLVSGRSFLIPLAFAVLLWNLLEAAIETISMIQIGKYRLPRPLAALLGIAVVVMCLYGVISIILGQADDVAAAWPRYVDRFEGLISQVAQWLGPDGSAKIRKLVTDADLTQRIPGLLFSAQSLITSLLLVIAYVAFLLAEGEHLGAKLAAMSSDKAEADRKSGLLSSISESIRRYIWIKTIVSVITAGTSYAVLRWIGIDFSETWAILIFVLNFIPNIGSIIAVAFPALIALVQFDSLTPFLTLVVGLTALQVAIGSALEPILMGSTLNMSPFAIILGLAFWGTIWGVAGMFLSVPILVLMMIVCAHVPSWRWIAILLSKDGRIDV